MAPPANPAASATAAASAPPPDIAPYGQRLYVRIWLAVVFTVALLTLAAGWVWRATTEPPPHRLDVRTMAGDVVGNGRPRQAVIGPNGASRDATQSVLAHPGSEFIVTMQDGQQLSILLRRPPRQGWAAWIRPFGFFWTLALVSLAVALATYPIIRKLTRRLERLQQGVERWGAGDLSARVLMRGGDEVAFLARRFNHAAERIEALVRAHKSLLANASHELRSPLARIRMGLELMGPGGATPDTARAEIARNIAELDQLIDEILLASRLDTPEADVGTPEAVDLTGLAAEEAARVGAELDVAPAAVGMEVPAVARLLRRAVRNLLENARRYGGTGPIELALSRADAKAGQFARAVILVRDHGSGVPPAERERIFEPFYRLPGASEREGGVGLGLALVRSIALRHGGSVRCEDRGDGLCGACFRIELPLVAPSAVAGAPLAGELGESLSY